MKKSLIVAAIAGIFAVPSAMAAEVNGGIAAGIDRSKVSGSANSAQNISATRISSGYTNISVSHSEEFDNGMSGDLFIQLHLPITTAGAGSSVNNRNSYVGISGGFGSVRLGTNENAYERMLYSHSAQDGDWSYGTISIMGVAPQSTGNDAGLTSHIWHRTDNTLMYFGPDGPLKIEMDYVFGGSGTSATRTPSLLSLALEYDMGGVGLFAGYQVATDWAGNGATPTAARDDNALLFGAEFMMGDLSANIAMENMEWKDTTNNVSTERSAFMVNATYPMASGNLALTYTNADDSDESNAGTNTTTNDGATGLYVGYYHPMGESTTLWAMYGKIKNDAAGTYNFATWHASPGAAGQDYTNYVFGIKHVF